MRARLEAMAGPTVEFRGHLPDEEVADLLARTRAFLFPGLEDFGIAPVEAQAAGRPVVAYARGGAAETVLDGTTGVLFHEQTVEAVIGGMRALDRLRIDPASCRRNAERFRSSIFRQQLMHAVNARMEMAEAASAAVPRPRLELA